MKIIKFVCITLLILLMTNIWLTTAQPLKNITKEFMKSQNPTIDGEIGYIFTVVQSNLNKKLRVNMTAPEHVNSLIIIVESTRTSTSQVKKIPCGYMKLGILNFESNAGPILNTPLIEYYFERKKFSNNMVLIDSTIVRIDQRNRTIVMKYENETSCKRDYNTIVTITGIFAYPLYKNGSCGFQKMLVQIGNETRCLPHLIKYYGAKKKLALIHAKFDISTKSVTKLDDPKVDMKTMIGTIVIITIVIIIVFALLLYFIVANLMQPKIRNDFQEKQSLCLIIANESFPDFIETKSEALTSSTISDKELLETTFRSLQFKIDLRENQSAEDMKRIFQDLTNINNTECLFVFILSHGFGGSVIGSCGNRITLHELLNPLLSSQSWKDVPKVAFLIGCSEEDHRKNFKSLTFPFEENCYIGIATSANRKGTNEPSFYVQDLCDAIKESQNGDIFKLTVDKARFCTERNLAMNGYSHNQHPEFMYSLKICLKTVSYFNDEEEIKTIKPEEDYDTVNRREQNLFNLDGIGLESYKLSDSKPRGLCLILYNDEFNDRHLSPLPWIKHDVELIENTFDKLGYEILTAENKSVNDMKKFVKDIDFHPEYDSLFLFVLSHGVNGEIYGSQGGEIHIQKLADQLNCCSNLEGKPKFIIVICSQSGSNFNKLTVPYIPDTLVVYTTHLQASEFKNMDDQLLLSNEMDNQQHLPNEMDDQQLLSNEMDDQQHLPNKTDDLLSSNKTDDLLSSNKADDLLSSNKTDDLLSLDETTTYFLEKFCNLIVNKRNRNIRLLFQSASYSTLKMIIRRNYNLAKRTFHYAWLNKKFSIVYGDDNYISNGVNGDQIPRDNVEFEQSV